ncbi:DUF2927 domain-containing protein [Arenibacterium halophilum]|uniref:DUF2927 domain-containing protein n=1 Tax=Arenibacterium halophilum TaxID=2583821 RepID=A0ABY2XE02_9RHOB|nr:DUF2927 domain-containing protein [Arenibacterium halophilum]TMV14698.1 DUF2927 domain-containing protein [Arenibacterium halophilum]
MKMWALLCAVLMLAACESDTSPDQPTRAQIGESSLPPMKTFGVSYVRPPVYSNVNIAQDFLDLHFQLESGRELPNFTRFEGPITLRVAGQAPASLKTDLTALLARLNREAGISISEISRGEANITVEAVNRSEIKRALPQAACFVVPNVSSLAEFMRNRRAPQTNWSMLRERYRMAVFLPNDTAPQEVRDCLHEELAQALGPLNDMYRLADSVFNDDNVHTILTGYDMLILRATYAPELHSGMSRTEVASRLPGILTRMNPRGDSEPSHAISATPRNWIADVQTALGPGVTLTTRRAAAARAARTASELGWQDHRRAFSHYMLGRMIQATDPVLAQQHYSNAMSYLERTPGTELHRAFIATQTAAFSVARGRGDEALARIEPHLDIARRAENAALLATLMLLQAEALDLLGRDEEAQAVRLDSLGWARYGFGSDGAVRAKMKEIAALAPKARRG